MLSQAADSAVSRQSRCSLSDHRAVQPDVRPTVSLYQFVTAYASIRAFGSLADQRRCRIETDADPVYSLVANNAEQSRPISPLNGLGAESVADVETGAGSR